jgi:hypothetical protein
MFYPNCRAEYRSGFTKCADCGADLIATLSAVPRAADTNVPRNSEGMELLWSGVSEALTDEIDAALEAAHVSYKITDREFGLLPNLEQSANFVWVDSRDQASARAILENVLAGSGAAEQESVRYPPDGRRINPFGLGRKIYPASEGYRAAPFESESLFESDGLSESKEPVPDDTVEDFNPDDATREVWFGDDREMAEYLKLCLTGVGIGCVFSENSDRIRLMVLPEAEKRAREVVREVVDAEPSQ